MINDNNFKAHSRALCFFLREVAVAKGITHQQIADKTGFLKTNVTRMLSGSYSPSLTNYLSLCNAIGINVFFEDKEGKTDLSEIFNRAMDIIKWIDPSKN